MPDWKKVATKAKAIVRKGPATLRNVVFSRLGIWPVGSLEGSDLRSVPTYCISLKRAPARRALMEEQARKMGLTQFRIVDAVDAKELSYEALAQDGRYADAETRRWHGRPLRLSEVACSLSHADVYATIVERGDPVSLIVEDDALFLTRRMRRIRLAELPPDWDVVFLNSFRFQEPPRGRIGAHLFEATSYNGSTAAYLVSQKGARKLRDVSMPVVHGADGLLGRSLPLTEGDSHEFRQQGARTTLQAYIVYPDCVVNGSTEYYVVSDVRQAK